MTSIFQNPIPNQQPNQNPQVNNQQQNQNQNQINDPLNIIKNIQQTYNSLNRNYKDNIFKESTREIKFKII